jgi:hypothetical protein
LIIDINYLIYCYPVFNSFLFLSADSGQSLRDAFSDLFTEGQNTTCRQYRREGADYQHSFRFVEVFCIENDTAMQYDYIPT